MWHTGIIEGYWWQAKVYDEGSRFGIDGGRVSKLHICRGEKWDWFAQVYGYSRGLDFDNCPNDIVRKVLEYCESL